MIILNVRLDCINDGSGPFDNEILQSILLVQVCVHVLLQRLFANSVVKALFVELDLLGINVNYCVLDLLLCQHPVLSAPNRSRVVILENGCSLGTSFGCSCHSFASGC